MADPSKINSLVLFKGKKVSTEKIDERILELLGLQDEYELSYDEYTGYLREAMVASRMSKSRYSTAETELITNEWKRVKTKKGRFKPKKISAESFKKGSAVGIQLGKKKLLKGISISSKRLALSPAVNKMTGGNVIEDIKNALTEIIGYLVDQNNTQKKILEKQRIGAEKEKRSGAESLLEKGFSKSLGLAQKMLAPVKSLLDRILDAIVAIFIGRTIVKLIEWFSDKDNKEKVKSIFKFLGEHWPLLLSLFLRFGTGLGRFVGTISKIVTIGIAKLAATVAQLVGAKSLSRFLGGRGGKLLQIGATVGTTLYLQNQIKNLAEPPSTDGQPTGGGPAKTPKFFGGGLANVKKLFGFSGGGSKKSTSKRAQGPGYIGGKKGVDKIPAMLSDGEFVMSRGAVQTYGTNTLEQMNAAGGGTNKPRMISGTTYAAEGGQIGTRSPGASLVGNEKIAYNQLQLNFPTAKPYHIAAALGNFSVEAPGLKPNTYQDGGGPGRGVAQWETPGRWDTAVKKYGPGIFNNLKQQMDYVKYEMDTGNPDSQGRPQLPWGNATKSTWLNSKNLIEATKNFMSGYEAPGVPHEEQRLSNAKRILNSAPSSSEKIASKPKPAKQQPNIFQKLGSGVASMFGMNQPAKAESIPKPKPRFSGGLAPQSSQKKGASIPTMTFSSSKSKASQKNISAPMNFMPEIVYEVAAPNKTKPTGGGSGGSPQVPSFSNVHASNNSIRNAKIYGVR